MEKVGAIDRRQETLLYSFLVRFTKLLLICFVNPGWQMMQYNKGNDSR